MVAKGDFGCAERERMVELAIEYGWIQRAAARCRTPDDARCVVVIVNAEAGNTQGPLGEMFRRVGELLPLMPRRMRKMQAERGCDPFLVFGVPLAELAKDLDPETADDLAQILETEEYAVLCVNNGGMALVVGVSRNEP